MGFTLDMLPTNLALYPDEGPYLAKIDLDWAGRHNTNGTDTSEYLYININLQAQAQTGRFSRCQGVFIDNSTNPCEVILTSQETGHVVRCPGFGQGAFPLFVGKSPVLVAQCGGQGLLRTFPQNWNITFGTTHLFFMNVPVKPFVQPWHPSPIDWRTYSVRNTGAANAPVLINVINLSSTLQHFALLIRKIKISISLQSVLAIPLDPQWQLNFDLAFPQGSVTFASHTWVVNNLTPGTAGEQWLAANHEWEFDFPEPILVPLIQSGTDFLAVSPQLVISTMPLNHLCVLTTTTQFAYKQVI
jgi:hypothetical protein